MEVVETRWGPALVLELRGRLDVGASPTVEGHILGLIQKGYIRLALDLSKMEYISSAGLRVLLTILKKVKSCSGKVALFGANKYVHGIFDIAGFSALFPMFDTLDQAETALKWNHPLAKFLEAPRSAANNGSYSGETIKVRDLQEEVIRVGAANGWEKETFLDEGERHLFILSRKSPGATKSFYLSTGMHGDEPAGPMAMLNLLTQNRWPSDWNIYLCPCLNPDGFRANTRSNADGVDLNRDYCGSVSAEIRAHAAWLEKNSPFSLAATMHEDWEGTGFYAFHLGPMAEESVIRQILEQASKICPIDPATTIDKLPAEHGVLDQAYHSLMCNEAMIDDLGEKSAETIFIRKAKSVWTEQVFLINRKTAAVYTFESASAFPMGIRVESLSQAVQALLACHHDLV